MGLKQKYIDAIARQVHSSAKMKCLRKLSIRDLKKLHHAFTEQEQKILELKRQVQKMVTRTVAQ